MENIKKFLTVNLFFNRDGNGYGNGYESGYGSGDGSGDENGYGFGYGNEYGFGRGNGYGFGYGNGYGNENGSGYGNGYGSGYGNENGSGDGNGYRNGYGNGNGGGYAYEYEDENGSGLKSLNNQSIHLIDNIQTIITIIKGNIAKGFIVNNDLSITPCYIAKGENQFVHGHSLKEAVKSLQKKLLIELPIEKRILNFKETFNNITKKYKAIDFYDWHYLLTGSCDLGRNYFVRNNNIDLDKDEFTVIEFIELTKNQYGSEIILKLKENYI